MAMKPALLMLCLALAAPVVLAGAALPRDVAAFVAQRDQCDHLRGEEAYDAERRADLERGLRRFCTGSDARLRALKHKYRRKPEVLAELERYEADIEGGAR